jgi:hypothetical protein
MGLCVLHFDLSLTFADVSASAAAQVAGLTSTTDGGASMNHYCPTSSRRKNPKGHRMHLGCSLYMRTNPNPDPHALIHSVTAAQLPTLVKPRGDFNPKDRPAPRRAAAQGRPRARVPPRRHRADGRERDACGGETGGPPFQPFQHPPKTQGLQNVLKTGRRENVDPTFRQGPKIQQRFQHGP